MKAVVQYKYGGTETLHLEDVSKPTIKDNEILIEVYAANIASGDMRINTLDVPFLLKPILRLSLSDTSHESWIYQASFSIPNSPPTL